MKTLNEWAKEQNTYGMTTLHDEDLIADQMGLLVNRLEGLTHGLEESQKTSLIEQFIKIVKERMLS